MRRPTGYRRVSARPTIGRVARGCRQSPERRVGPARLAQATEGTARAGQPGLLRRSDAALIAATLVDAALLWRLLKRQITERATDDTEHRGRDIPYPFLLRRAFRFLDETRARRRPRNWRSHAGTGERKRYGSEGLLGIPVAAYEKVRDGDSRAAGFDQQDDVLGSAKCERNNSSSASLRAKSGSVWLR